MKVGILTFHFADNIGAVLNAYGLQRALQKMGVAASFINFVPRAILDHSTVIPSPRNAIYDNSSISAIVRGFSSNFVTRIINLPIILERKQKFAHFRNNFLNVCDEPFEILSSYHCEQFDSCIVGSDQVWNPHFLELSNLAYLLPFELQNTVKIAYATSIAEELSPHSMYLFRKYLKSFSFISVREFSTAVELSKAIKRQVQFTLDPTFLLDEKDYEKISQKPDIELPEKYILVYRFGRFINNPVDQYAQKISSKMGIPLISIGGTGFRDNVASPSEFLWLLKNATHVITNSYHGTILSIFFKKNLCVIPYQRPLRIRDILTHLKLDEKVINVKRPFENIDYSYADNILSEDKMRSLEFLRNALNR